MSHLIIYYENKLIKLIFNYSIRTS